jgi:hypothetical protein
MSRAARNIALALLGAAALACGQAAAAGADENLGVSIITQAQGSGYTDVGETDFGEANLTAMYVDSSGAAHVAYTARHTDTTNNGEIVLCTIPAGGSSCGSKVTLTTDGTTSDEPIQSLKYLPDGNGSAVLAVGLSLIGSGNAPFSASGNPVSAPWTETEVFQPGSSTGKAIGATYDQGGQSAGDEIYIPDDNGIDIVGLWSDYDWPSPGAGSEADDYQFESFTSPSDDDTQPLYLGVEAAQAGGDVSGSEALPGEWPAGVTELANGEVGVLSYDITHDPDDTNPGLSSVGMYVQPESGGSFSSLRDLGINGPVETQFAPTAETYLVDGVSSNPSGGNVPEDLELYEFQGTSLEWLGTIGATDDSLTSNPLNLESQWDTMPPIYEDDSGNLYAAWYANGGDDACPGSEQSGSTVVSGCLMYREVGSGGVMGPKVVLNEAYGGDSNEFGDVDQIAANSSGAGWVLDWREPGSSSTWTLYATPLTAAATVPTSPTVTGTVTSVPLTCTGTGACSLSVSLDSTASAVRASAGQAAARSAKLLARRTFTVKAGRHLVRLRLALGAKGGRALRHARSLRARLVVTQSLGLTNVKKQIYSRTLTLERP